MEYVIYCDESVAKGAEFSNFYGGLLVRSRDLEYVENLLLAAKAEQNLLAEIKWQKITHPYKEKYIAVMDRLFDLICDNIIKARVMFTQNLYCKPNLTSYQRENSYFLLYYQFIKHAFGLQFHECRDRPILIRLYLDQLPDAEYKANLFRTYSLRLGRQPEFRDANLRFAADAIHETCSHEHIIAQCLDILLGSMQFRLNKKHKQKLPGQSRRPNRTRAKEAVYRHIQSRIQEIYPRFNIGITTGMRGNRSNLWRDPYRHWKFLPRAQPIRSSVAAQRQQRSRGQDVQTRGTTQGAPRSLMRS